VRFQIPLEEGGRVVGSAASLEYDGEDRAVLTGDVHICFKDMEVKAHQVILEPDAERIEAMGEVIFDQGPRRLAGETMELDLASETGRLTDARAFVSTDYFFEGDEIAKTGASTYTVTNGVFTSCEGEVPPWSFKVRRATVTADGYAKARGATLRTKNVPIFYLPYVLWPVRDDRSSGFLVPKPGYSSRRGASLGLAYYQTLGRSWDTTFYADLFSGGAEMPAAGEGAGNYFGFGNEVRYRPSEGTEGRFEGYLINDPERDEVRWRVRYDHQSRDLPLGLRAVVAIEDVSDFEFFEDFERSVEANSRRQLYSNAFLSGNWGAHSLNVLVDHRETFLQRGSAVELRQLPEVEYRLRSTRLGRTPLYLQLRGALHYLDVERSELLDNTYGRANLFPELTLPVRSVPWFSMAFTVGGQLTWYGDSLLLPSEREPDRESDFRGESLTRTTPTARVELVGPSFSRVFEGKGKVWSRFKHIVEPRFDYVFLDGFDEQGRVPVFDEIDSLTGQNVGRFALVNRLLAKPADEKLGGAREILSFELFQDYSFDDERPLQRSGDGSEVRQAGSPGLLVRYTPTDSSQLRAEVRYSTLFGEVESTALSASYGIAPGYHLGLRWTARRDPELSDTQTNQLRLSTRLALVPRKLSLATEVNYDVERSLVQFQRYLLDFTGSCYGISLDVADLRAGTRRDREYRLLVTLKNVGSFLDVTGGRSEQL
jgi:LPS-assembly protein